MKIEQIPADAKQILQFTEALLEGHFVLSSGLHSKHYLQCAKLLQYPEVADLISRELAATVPDEKVDLTLAPALGGIVIGYELARALQTRAVFAERPGERFTLRRGFEIKPGEKVLIVEDVITTGGSVMELYELAKAMNAQVLGFAAIIDRSGGKFNPGEPVYSWLQIEVATFAAEDCELCRDGVPVTKPGSRR
jgi:orotate phosphoribosyltransferase